MAKIAADLKHALACRNISGAQGCMEARILAKGEHWAASDVLCTSGPRDRPFEERHSRVAIAMVLAGTFQYRSTGGRELMTPGSLLLGDAGQSFECGHEHGEGDRCLSFQYEPEFFRRLAFDATVRNAGFRVLRVPAVRPLSPLIAQGCVALASRRIAPMAWEELAIRLAAQTLQLCRGLRPPDGGATIHAEARVSRVVRILEDSPATAFTLDSLARLAGLSPYHFLRTFERVTGVTPHRYLRRARLREAAERLTGGTEKVLDIALDCGFGDVSNFNRAFRAELGASPREYRRKYGKG